VTSIEQRDVQSVLAGIDDLLPLIAKRAQATEDLRKLPDDTVAELDEVGFFKLLQPEQWGGLQTNTRPVDFGSFLIPRSEYRIDDVWHVVGLRGTGSNTVVVKDVFVPRHRFLSYKSMNDRTAGGLQTNTAPVYKMPWGTVHPTTISAPIVGMAYGAYDAHVEHQGKRVRAAFAGEKAKDDPFAKVRIAEAASDIDAAWRQLIGNVGDEYALLKADKEIPFELRARARRDQVRATGRAIASIDRLFEASGATALNNDAPVQRFWRDAHAGRVHAANDPERAYLIFGNNEFGLPPQDTMV
jgi:3-hydroxy-9,10-secoandrosta-1,3,5(10)-triene-9,17-dione monooxygenase